MAFTTENKFDFVSQALSSDTFGVVNFKGSEGFSKCYEFEITLVATDPEIDLDKVLQNPVTFTILREDGDIPFHGILAQFDQLHAVDEYVYYRAVLVPKLWWLSLTHHNQVFLNKKIPEIIKEVLKDGGLTTMDFELRLQKSYAQWDYICQYRESHLAFVSRWMERDGMYFYFEQTDSGEKMIITDSKITHTEMPQGKTMYYLPPSGLDDAHREEAIKAFVCRQKMLPKNLRLKDYNYRTPSLEVSGNAQVKANGRGDVYIYGEHFRTPEEGNALAKVRAEELLCREKLFYGESTIPYLRTGYLFDLQDHYRNSYNEKYLTIEIEHQGSQTAFLLAGVQRGLSDMEAQVYYRNSFVSIPSGVQLRAERKTEKARFYGTMNAKIDAAGSGQYAELDDQGRYKVILPFDLSGRKDGKASTYLRMAQPYAGTDHGMHFPLHKGTDVLLTFIDGDPDRPIVAAAVPNPEHPSPITSADQTMSKITTSGGNKIHMEDQEGSQRILMQSPTANTWLRMGAPNDPSSEGGASDDEKPVTHGEFDEEYKKASEEHEGYSIYTDSWYLAKIGAGKIEIVGPLEQKINFGNVFETIGGLEEKIVLGNAFEFVFGGLEEIHLPVKLGYSNAEAHLKGEVTEAVGEANRLAGNQIRLLGEATRVAGVQTQAVGDATRVAGVQTQALGEATRVAGVQTQAVGEATRVAGVQTQALGEATRVAGVQTVLLGERMATIGSEVKTVLESAKIMGEDSQLTGMKIIL